VARFSAEPIQSLREWLIAPNSNPTIAATTVAAPVVVSHRPARPKVAHNSASTSGQRSPWPNNSYPLANSATPTKPSAVAIATK
jgi:hypothetical protein